MKKALSFILALSLIFGLTACNRPTPPIEEDLPEDPVVEIDSEVKYWTENMPKMDGSTSLIPLEAGIRSALLDISVEEATAQVTHTTTHDSFYNLLNEAVDLIFSVPISEDQAKVAADRNIALEQVAVAKEGFVFVVNAKNPVESLTQEQLRDIYSGKITNWKEVGGNDEEIIAYQRNQDSGSQNYMTKFMGDTPLMDAPIEKRPGSMSGLMDVIAVNDYAEQSIGYSVYAYAADMYGNGDEIKFLAIDGVAPNKATMASGEYPLLSENFAIFRASEAEDSPVRKLCDWIVSDEGQTAVASAGYVTVRDIGVDYAELEAAAAYSGVGSGYLEDWDTPIWQCVASDPETVHNYDSIYNLGATLPLKVTLPADAPQITQYERPTEYTTGIIYELECLNDQELQNKVNSFIADAVKQADANSEDLYNHLCKINTEEYLIYSQMRDWYNNIDNCYPSAIVTVKAKNGYIWATVAQAYTFDAQDGYEKYYKTYARAWDLFTGEELSAEDLFRKGLDIDEFLNGFLRKASQTALDSWGTYPKMKAEFARLPETGWTVTPDAVYIDFDNPYFGEGYRFAFNKESGVLCSEVYRDMSGLFTDDVINATFLCQSPYEPVYASSNNGYPIQLLDETVGNSEIRAKINESFLKNIEEITFENAAKYFTEQGHPMTADEIDSMYDWALKEYGDKIAVFTSFAPLTTYIYEEPFNLSWPEPNTIFIYDLQTGKELSWQDLLIEGWEENCKVEAYDTTFNGDYNSLPVFDRFIITYSGKHHTYPLMFAFHEKDNYSQNYELYLPLSALKIAEGLPQ